MSMSARRYLILGLMVWGLAAFHCVVQTAVAQEEPAAEAEGEAAEEGEGEGHAQESDFMWMVKTSGAIGAIILILSIYFISTVIKLFLELRADVLAPPELLAKCDELLQQRDFKGIYQITSEDDSFFGRAVATGISEMPNGLADAREAMQHVGEAETVEMEKSISMLAVLGTLGPMIGLLGTLKGMIAAFSVIARSDTQLKASAVAEAISEALLLTFEGVALSVPAIYFFAVFRNRVSSLSVSTMLQADHFLRRFAQVARSKGGPAPQPGARGPAAPAPA